MLRKNTRRLQIPLTRHLNELPQPFRKRLQASWTETSYQEFFCPLDEKPFAVLYSDLPWLCPNIPVNVLVNPEFLKAANGWTDKKLHDRVCYDVQVPYAIGYCQLYKGHLDLRTLYDFREQLARHMQEMGESLLEQAFEKVSESSCGHLHSRWASSAWTHAAGLQHPPAGTGTA